MSPSVAEHLAPLCTRCAWRCSIAAAAFRQADVMRRKQAHEAQRACTSDDERQHRARTSTVLGLRAHYWERLGWGLMERVENPRGAFS